MDDIPQPGPSSAPLFVRQTINNIHSTSSSFLISTSPIKSSSKPPIFHTNRISPKKADSHYYKDLLMFPACTPYELWLQNVLLESEVRDSTQKDALMEAQAGLVLSNLYSVQVNRQLQAKEEKKSTKGKKRLMGDGKAKLFSGDKFYQLCVDDEQQRQEDIENANERRDARRAQAEKISEWKKDNKAIKERNKAKKEEFSVAVAAWEAEKEMAKAEKRKPRWNKPKWKDYNPKKMKPRPKKPAEHDGDDGDENSGSDDDVESD
ncbi:hypothetical protein EV359DRAFT_52403 [Lentinula novae-zelandiae]|nr:hypothetical protein EV359DRAFT_52403 [Lentinula novae-zelandiae]